jgi:hypothetical protein
MRSGIIPLTLWLAVSQFGCKSTETLEEQLTRSNLEIEKLKIDGSPLSLKTYDAAIERAAVGLSQTSAFSNDEMFRILAVSTSSNKIDILWSSLRKRQFKFIGEAVERKLLDASTSRLSRRIILNEYAKDSSSASKLNCLDKILSSALPADRKREAWAILTRNNPAIADYSFSGTSKQELLKLGVRERP